MRLFQCLLLSASMFGLGLAVNHTSCESGGRDSFHLTKLTLSPENPQPGSRLCVNLEAAPESPIREGSVVRMTHTEFTIEQSLCRIKGLSCPLTAGASMSATVCGDVPLTAVLLAGQRLQIRASIIDEAGAPIGCLNVAVFIDDTIGLLDPDVEDLAAQSHTQLREAMRVVSDAHGAVTSDEERAERVRPLLRAAYEASPHWAGLYKRWRDVHGNQHHRSLDSTSADGTAQRMLSEALSFVTFRSNLLHAYHAGRRVELDERSDLPGDVQRTLSHFS